ncbi:MAG: hypothetical protein ABIS86_01330 [Streptosporangiaceae bacterium]
MTTEDLAVRLRSAVARKRQAAEVELHLLIEALQPDSGIRQAEVARITGYSREHLRRVAREHDIPSSRPAPGQA